VLFSTKRNELLIVGFWDKNWFITIKLFKKNPIKVVEVKGNFCFEFFKVPSNMFIIADKESVYIYDHDERRLKVKGVGHN